MTYHDDTRPAYTDYPAWWREHGPELLNAYQRGDHSFVPGLLPSEAVQLTGVELLQTLYGRLGGQLLEKALDPTERIPSPVSQATDGEWIKSSRTVGINVRTIGNFFNVVKYALTLPAHIDCVHLLPIWEAGVVASLYGMASRQLNPEFFSPELAIQFSRLSTVEDQLTVTINLLHALGKKVGMDVIPHTDRYSEIVLANPDYFEWLHRDGLTITSQSLSLSGRVEVAILDWLQQHGPVEGDLTSVWPSLNQQRFFREMSEAERLRMLFGPPEDHQGRQQRRISLVDHLYHLGLEPVPATMAPPYRGLEVDQAPEAQTIDEAGRVWRDYKITHPQEMSRVFGPLTRYRLYGRKDDNANWEIDFAAPRPEVWAYVQQFYAEQQRRYGFDFMRGDMSHVQMRKAGVPAEPDPDYYDLLGSVKQHIRQQAPYFAYFAESFLTAPDYMAYGNEVDHLEASLAEVTLGNLQSMETGSAEFSSNLRRYLDIAENRRVKPAFTIITGDKDDPRFDRFYLHGNVARVFFSLFMDRLPSYTALGFEQRDVHPFPAPNEQYTKLYVFQLREGPKATHGPYQWGRNTELFFRLNRLHLFAETLLPKLRDGRLEWLLYPDAGGELAHCAWVVVTENRSYLFLINFGTDSVSQCRVPVSPSVESWRQLFSTHHQPSADFELRSSDRQVVIPLLHPGEGQVFEEVLPRP